jgi:hypothetical protein
MMFEYFSSQIDLWWICLLPYLLIGAAAFPVILMGLLYGWLQIFLIFIGLIDTEMVQKNFLPALFQKVLH